MTYKVYTYVNYVEKPGDKDDIHVHPLSNEEELDNAIELAQNYIDNFFFKKDAVIAKSADGVYRATDSNRYHKQVIIEPNKE